MIVYEYHFVVQRVIPKKPFQGNSHEGHKTALENYKINA